MSRTSWANTAWRRCRSASIEVAFELAGFRPAQRQNVRLTVGFTARIDVSLGLATVAETVTVAGAAPVVDVASTSGSTLFTQEMLEAIPTARNGLISLLNLAPGVRSFLDIGGNTIEENPQARTFGQSGQVWFTIDGVSTTHLTAGGGDGSYWDYETIDEARVQSLGTDAEFQTRGVQMTAIVKSGGNQFHGGGSWAQNNKQLPERQHRRRVGGPGLHDRQRAQDAVRPQRRPGRPHHSEQVVVLRCGCASATRKRRS